MKILFNNAYGLKDAVMQETKNQTRRTVTRELYNQIDWKYFDEGHLDCLIDPENEDISILDCGQYHIGDVVAIAQSYKELYEEGYINEKCEDSAGWGNKMFVKEKFMPHHIKITNVRVERLQDISDEDCLKEGIHFGYSSSDFDEGDDLPDVCYKVIGLNSKKRMDYKGCTAIYDSFKGKYYYEFYTPKDAYAVLIEKTCGKGVWEKNPYVFVYDFELVD